MEILLEELHEGICGSHTGGKSLAHRALTQGYWWPSMQKSSQEYVKKCNQGERSKYPSTRASAEPIKQPLAFSTMAAGYRGAFS